MDSSNASFHLPTFFDTNNLSILFGNMGEILKFVMPILFLFLAVKFAGQFIQMVKRTFKSFKLSSSNRNQDDYKNDYQDDYKGSRSARR